MGIHEKRDNVVEGDPAEGIEKRVEEADVVTEGLLTRAIKPAQRDSERGIHFFHYPREDDAASIGVHVEQA